MSTKQRKASSRPLEHWRTSAYAGATSNTFAQDLDLAWEIQQIQGASLSTTIALRRWAKERKPIETTRHLRYEPLFCRFPVDRERWWRRRGVAPGFVRLPDLYWGEPGPRIVPHIERLFDLALSAANVLAAHDQKASAPFKPTKREVESALEHLAQSSDAIDSELLALRVLVDYELGTEGGAGDPAWTPLPIESQEARVYHHKPHIDEESFTLHFRGQICQMHEGLPYKLLIRLAKRPGHYVHATTIYNDVWGDSLTDRKALQQVATRLRRMLEQAGIEGLDIDGCSSRGSYRLRF